MPNSTPSPTTSPSCRRRRRARRLDEARYQRGAKLAQERICASCHNADYSGREQMPRLAGQHPEVHAQGFAGLSRRRPHRHAGGDAGNGARPRRRGARRPRALPGALQAMRRPPGGESPATKAKRPIGIPAACRCVLVHRPGLLDQPFSLHGCLHRGPRADAFAPGQDVGIRGQIHVHPAGPVRHHERIGIARPRNPCPSGSRWLARCLSR